MDTCAAAAGLVWSRCRGRRGKHTGGGQRRSPHTHTHTHAHTHKHTHTCLINDDHVERGAAREADARGEPDRARHREQDVQRAAHVPGQPVAVHAHGEAARERLGERVARVVMRCEHRHLVALCNGARHIETTSMRAHACIWFCALGMKQKQTQTRTCGHTHYTNTYKIHSCAQQRPPTHYTHVGRRQKRTTQQQEQHYNPHHVCMP